VVDLDDESSIKALSDLIIADDLSGSDHRDPSFLNAVTWIATSYPELNIVLRDLSGPPFAQLARHLEPLLSGDGVRTLSLVRTMDWQDSVPSLSLVANPKKPVLVENEPLFGPEFGFTNSAIISEKIDGRYARSPLTVAKLEEWSKLAVEGCKTKGCEVTTERDKHGRDIYRVRFPDGFYYLLTTDPQCLEINMKPMTLRETVARRDQIQAEIFDQAKRLGLMAHEYFGGGSIHIDRVSGFGESTRLFRDFIVDYNNHFTLPTVTQGRYLVNAPPVIFLPPANIARYEALISDPNLDRMTIPEFAERLTNEVYTANPGHLKPLDKYQAANVTRVLEPKPNRQTVEIRGISAQASVDDYLKVIWMYQLRINRLKSRIEAGLKPVPFHVPKEWREFAQSRNDWTDGSVNNYVMYYPNMYQFATNQLAHYIRESGGSWETFASLYEKHVVTPGRLRDNKDSLSHYDRRNERAKAAKAWKNLKEMRKASKL
jgi:hypothetical protein